MHPDRLGRQPPFSGWIDFRLSLTGAEAFDELPVRARYFLATQPRRLLAFTLT